MLAPVQTRLCQSSQNNLNCARNLTNLETQHVAELEENATVRELSLRGNNMGNAGAAALGGSLLKAFKSSCRVAKLDLSDNGVCEAGGVALAGLLATPALPLKQADLSWNSLRAGGTVAIAECLKTASLVRLNLSWNGMGERGNS